MTCRSGTSAPRSDRQGQFVERDCHPPARWFSDRQLIVSAPNVLDESMPRNNHPGATVLFEPAHRPQPCLQPTVICFDTVVAIPIGVMPRHRQQVIEHRRIRRCPVGCDLYRRDPRRADGVLEEPAGRRGVSPCGDQHVDDLPELVDRSVDVPPVTSHFTYVSSTCQRSPTACRQGRAASASSGVKRSTHR